MAEVCPRCGQALPERDPVGRLRAWCEQQGMPVDPLGRVCEADAAELVGVDPASLRNDRASAQPRIPFVRIGGRRIRYALDDLAAYLCGERIA